MAHTPTIAGGNRHHNFLKYLFNRRKFLWGTLQLTILLSAFQNKDAGAVPTAQSTSNSDAYGLGNYGQGSYLETVEYKIYLPFVNKEGE